MGLAKTYAISLIGLNGSAVEIEADVSPGLPSFTLVGLPDTSLSESSSRVRSATHNSGLSVPSSRITVNLSPASIPKFGSSFDLGIAVATLAAAGRVSQASVASWLHVGELGLDGSVRPVPGVLPTILAAKNAGFTRAVVPLANQAEAELVQGVRVFAAGHLAEVANLHGAEVMVPTVETRPGIEASAAPSAQKDISEISGHEGAIESLTIAAIGGHHLMLYGPPGAGKTMLAERLPTILPPLALEQALETTAVHSISNLMSASDPLMRQAPFEAPHHSISASAMVGGGMGKPRPGAISLAHNGVLFLDEATEFQQPVLEALRQPLESGQITISRAAGRARFPAKFQLILAANPCPCGHYGSGVKPCQCSSTSIARYASKISGPLADRIDIRQRIRVTSPASLRVTANTPRRTSAEIRSQVVEARARSARRLSGSPWALNSEVPGSYLRAKLPLGEGDTEALDKLLKRSAMTMRGYDRCIRVAWSIADMRQVARPGPAEIDLALMLRGNDLTNGGWR